MTDDANRDGRSAAARGYVLASRVMSIGLTMAVPMGLGWWADTSWKTTPWLTILGVVLGFVTAMLELIQLAKEGASDDQGSDSKGGPVDGSGRGDAS